MMIVIMINICFILSSCEKVDNTKPEITLIVDRENLTNYDASLVNPNEGSISFIKLNTEGSIEYLDVLYNEGQSMMNASFYENGLVKSIGNEEYTIVFSNYNGNKVDIVFVYEDEIQMFKEYEGNVDWSSLMINESGVESGTRSGDSGVFDWMFSADGFLYNFNKNKTVLGYVGTLALDIAKTVYLGATEATTQKVFKSLAKWLFDIPAGAVDLVYGNESMSLKIKDMGEVVIVGALSGPWAALFSLVSNYPSYVDLCTDMWLKFFEWKDGNYYTNVELGTAVLNSGAGELKVTLSWDYYADIDLYVVEPNETVIYWKTPYSYYTGGFLDVDNRIGGPGATENIFWNSPEDGEYTIILDYYGASTLNNLTQSGTCKVTIMYKGVGTVYSVSMTKDDCKKVTDIVLPSGVQTRSKMSFGFNLNSLLQGKRIKP